MSKLILLPVVSSADSIEVGDARVPYQPASLDIWGKKYQLKDHDGQPVDKTLQDTFRRLAKTLSDIEAPERREHWFKEFTWALNHGAIPAGRITSNAGADAFKPATSTINCTVSGTIHDSMDDILTKVHEAGMTLKAGCGIGYEFSTLRPSGAYVAGAGAYTSGPMSFMDIYDKMCFTVSSAGGRRGAQMGTFDVGHPDVEQFIEAKREDGRLRQFNLSLLITRAFIDAVRNDEDWPLVFPVSRDEIRAQGLDLHDTSSIVWRHWPTTERYETDAQGRVAMRVYKTVRARDLWNKIMRSTYDFADPGFILIDEVNDMNNNWFCEDIRATNPCGEQPLPPYGSCLLGSINLVHFVRDPFTQRARFDWDSFKRVVSVFTRMLDNVVEINGLPLEGQRREIERKRRHGMGYLGLGSAMAMLCMAYGSPESVSFTEEVTKVMAIEGWRTGLALAQEKGPAPIMNERFTVTEAMLHARPEMAADGYKVGDEVEGRVLHALYSRYMQRLACEEPELVRALAEVGARFTHHTSIAPTGTIALSIGNNVSNGIEPSFSHEYTRNILEPGKKSKVAVTVYSFEMLAYRRLISMDGALPDYMQDAHAVSPTAHVNVQAAAQRWVDSSISKTINVATEMDFESFKDIYLYAAASGLKGCTTFRFNPDAHQGVLVLEKDLADTLYTFTLDTGEVVTLKGNEEVEYDGATHRVANLYDALKENYYGKTG